MKSLHQYSLKHLNSFGYDAVAPTIYFPKSVDDLKLLVSQLPANFYILGEGSNTLFTEDTAPCIIKPEFNGISVEEDDHTYILSVGCSENWHQLVSYCIQQGYRGLENLALIPGSVGAAPIQNIGAYGVEIADVLDSVTWFSFDDLQTKTLTNQECQFAYRDSIFKHQLKDKGIIVEVKIKLSKAWHAKKTYAGLDQLPEDVSAEQIFNQVIKIRSAKLPDPKVIPNAGSFFKNPVVEQAQFQILHQQYPDMPFYPQSSGQVKLAAGWLIEQAGFKGLVKNGVGVHDKQALVLVNHGSDNGYAIFLLAQEISQQVFRLFNVRLTPEVRMVDHSGYIAFEAARG
ncbi:UDP-N-acetylmuramate dehydrogenase [Thalassotalea ganghwensis]